MKFSSKLIEEAVNEVSKLPGIGKKSALRVVLYLLKQDPTFTKQLTRALSELRDNIQYCQKCYNIADDDLCTICRSPHRDNTIICIVESFKDIMAIENTGQYQGVYHVLGGLISPLEGITPGQLKIEELIDRLSQTPTKEVILALSPTMEGDTTAFYITKKVKPLVTKTTTLARGVPIGGELEYTDELTLARSIQTRVNYE